MILLDTDVILDVALGRAPHLEASAALLDQIERGGRGAFVAWHTLANLYDLIRPARGDADARAPDPSPRPTRRRYSSLRRMSMPCFASSAM